jgi:hypothetical protein
MMLLLLLVMILLLLLVMNCQVVKHCVEDGFIVPIVAKTDKNVHFSA